MLSALPVRFYYTAAGTALSAKHGVDDRLGAADAGLYRYRTSRTVLRAGPAFHAGIPVENIRRALLVHAEHAMRADGGAHAAAHAAFLVKLQRYHIL